MKYQWVLFDADDTLFHFDAYSGLRLMFSRFQFDFDLSDYEYYQSLNKPLWVAYQDGSITAKQLQTQRFEPWARQLAISTTALNSAFLAAMADICTLLPGARELIDALTGRCRLGIITNGFTELQTVRLERTGLKYAFDPVIISEEVGAAKPDAIIFEHAFERMGHPPREQVLMVGDNPHSDIKGGLNAGIHTCWVNSRGHDRPVGIEPHHEVANLNELKSWLFVPSG